MASLSLKTFSLGFQDHILFALLYQYHCQYKTLDKFQDFFSILSVLRLYPGELLIVSQRFCNKLPEIFWLEPREVYSFTILESRTRKSRCQQAHSPSKGSKEESFLASSSFWGSKHCLTCGYISSISASIFTWPFLCVWVSHFYLL